MTTRLVGMLPARAPLAPFDLVFGHALAGEPCHLEAVGSARVPLPVNRWRRPADDVDVAMIAECVGATIDVGCGPGRLTVALAECGHVVLGIDITSASVAATADRGGPVLQRDVFGPLPGEGRWETALLADGNIGIGGDPVALLGRIRTLLTRQGRVVVEVDPPGATSRVVRARLRCDCARTRPFDWFVLGMDDVVPVARSAGFRVLGSHERGERCWTVLEVA